jgi:Holliday junction resolvase RusA-like endonuclease
MSKALKNIVPGVSMVFNMGASIDKPTRINRGGKTCSRNEQDEKIGETHNKTINTYTTNNNNNLYICYVVELGGSDGALRIVIPGAARGKDRARSGGQGQRPHTTGKTRSAEDWVRAHAIQQVGQPCLTGPLALVMIVDVAIPPSWPEKRRSAALAGLERPTGKPDADNMLKLAMDALNRVLWRDDAQIVDVAVSKRYAAAPQTVLIVSRPHQPNSVGASQAAPPAAHPASSSAITR